MRAVAELFSGLGFYPVGIGPLRYTHLIEALHTLRYSAGEFKGRESIFTCQQMKRNIKLIVSDCCC